MKFYMCYNTDFENMLPKLCQAYNKYCMALHEILSLN